MLDAVCMHGSQSFVKGIEDPPHTNQPGEMMPVQIGFQIGLHMRQHESHALSFKILMQFEQHAGRGVIHMGDRSGIHDQPTHTP